MVNFGKRVVIIEFVVCDDEKLFRTSVIRIIDKIFIKNNEDYKIIEYSSFDKDFQQMVKDNKKARIYILDIELNDGISGIDIARAIRKKDWNSVIILVTSHNEMGYEALKAQIMLLDFICKYDKCDTGLENAILKAIEQLGGKKAIRFSSFGISYIVHLDDIIYIMKDTIERKCIIKTTYNEMVVNKTINYMINETDERFYLTHRSCLVNTEYISKIDWKNNVIYFRGGEQIDLLSRDRKKGLKMYVSN